MAYIDLLEYKNNADVEFMQIGRMRDCSVMRQYTTMRLGESGPPWKAGRTTARRNEYERSGTNDDADGCRGDPRDCGSGRCWISLGFLVSSGAEFGDRRAEAGDGDAVGSAAGAGADIRRKGVCNAGFLPAPGDTSFLWAA